MDRSLRPTLKIAYHFSFSPYVKEYIVSWAARREENLRLREQKKAEMAAMIRDNKIRIAEKEERERYLKMKMMLYGRRDISGNTNAHNLVVLTVTCAAEGCTSCRDGYPCDSVRSSFRTLAVMREVH